MKAKNFLFGEHCLDEFGMVLCRFDSSGGFETVSDGCEITFNTVPVHNGKKHELTSVQFETCLETTLWICKFSCKGDIQEITAAEHRQLTKWLCRNSFKKLKILDENSIDLYCEAIINVKKIELEGRLYGLELNIFTNRPYMLKEQKTVVINNKVKNGKHSINDESHEEGYIYPITEITMAQAGELKIHNAMENRDTVIKNCVSGEVITMDYPVISSSLSSHNIQNDFNWQFFRLANTYEESRNDLTISLPCTIKVKYSPIVKVGL